MDLERYPYFVKPSLFDFEFYSVGVKGTIKKIARFRMVGQRLCNFSFGDFDMRSGQMIDNSISDNGDVDKIIATVAAIIFDFTGRFPWLPILVKGLTPSRTRKYQMGLNKNLNEVIRFFEIFGFKNGEWEYFRPNQNYEAFIGRRRQIPFE